MNHSILLGVNIDHVATLRQARGTTYPDPLAAMHVAEAAGADGITVHLREDRRHIQPRDVELMQQQTRTRINLEMAVTDEMVAYACRLRPAHCCLVPEKRAELTTEGGLDVAGQRVKITTACQQLRAAGIEVSLFIDPDERQIDASIAAGAPVIEIHTGTYADAAGAQQQQALQRIIDAVNYAACAGLIVNAGHGLQCDNVAAIAALPHINELNIGHALVARAIFVGLGAAIQEMKAMMLKARRISL